MKPEDPETSTSPPEQRAQFYRLPNRSHYIANSDKINDISSPVRVGQLTLFTPFEYADPGKVFWLGITTAQISSPHWKGMESVPIRDEDPGVLKGRRAYEVMFKQRPPAEDYTTDGNEVAPKGRVAGEVMSVATNYNVWLKVEDRLVESDVFKEG